MIDKFLGVYFLGVEQRILCIHYYGDLPIIDLVVPIQRSVLTPDGCGYSLNHPPERVEGRVIYMVDLAFVLVCEVSAARELLALVS